MYANLIQVNPNKITTVRYAYTRFFGRVYKWWAIPDLCFRYRYQVLSNLVSAVSIPIYILFFFVIQVKDQLYNWLKEKEKDNKYTKSSGYTVQGGGYGGETVEPQRDALPRHKATTYIDTTHAH